MELSPGVVIKDGDRIKRGIRQVELVDDIVNIMLSRGL